MKANHHESIQNIEKVKVSSERSFGLVMSVFFLIVAVYPFFKKTGPVREWALIVSAAFILPALIYPRILKPLNLLWFKFGMLLSKIINPIIMGILFFIVVTPIGILARLTGKDFLRLKKDPSSGTYWINTEGKILNEETLRKQF